MKLDLHIHTTYSDGDCTPREVAALARQAGLDGIAITDHDECRGYGGILEDANTDMPVYAGIELAAKYDGEVHVLGLGIDWQDKTLVRHAEDAAVGRQQRAALMIERINKAGLDIAMHEVEKECGGGVLGRPHFAAAFVKKGYAKSHKEAFVRYLSSHAPFYIPLDKVEVSRAAEMILGAGGIAVLAHPGLVKTNVLQTLLPRLGDMGFWGIEAYHPAHTDRQCIAYAHLAKRYGLYVTAGSDFHGSVKPHISIGQEKRGGKYLDESMEAFISM
ncbi:MAG: PHP domain-containing protein [Eubacteriales bacterium]|nr:PHP domain-containing protein [Eubacteriales bacterium]